MACRQAGYSAGAWAYTTNNFFRMTHTSRLNETMSSVGCAGNETSLLQCPYHAANPTQYYCRWNYLTNYVAGVFCRGEAIDNHSINHCLPSTC